MNSSVRITYTTCINPRIPPQLDEIELFKKATAELLKDIHTLQKYSSKGLGVYGEQNVFSTIQAFGRFSIQKVTG